PGGEGGEHADDEVGGAAVDVHPLALVLPAFDDDAVRVGVAEELVELVGELVGVAGGLDGAGGVEGAGAALGVGEEGVAGVLAGVEREGARLPAAWRGGRVAGGGAGVEEVAGR